MKKLLVWLCCVVMLQFALVPAVNAAEVQKQDDLAKYFEDFSGTFVLFDPAKDLYTIYNQEQSQKRLSPCSTFKIFNSLIGLETGVLDEEDVYTLKQWNGTHYDFPAWNQNQTLASATRDSVVWYFKELAQDIGQERMQAYIDQINYGNRDLSGGLTKFWLRSSLQISAVEQVDLLQKLYTGQLPFAAAHRTIVLQNITLADQSGLKLLGKTGSGFQDGKWVLGWFVGYVEKQGSYYVFATNIEAEDGATGGKAREITKAILRDMGFF